MRGLPLAAARASAAYLDRLPLDREAQRRRSASDGGGDAGVVELRRRTAARADQELAHMGSAWTVAADIGVKRFDPVNETFPHEEFESAIDGRRRGAGMSMPEGVKDVIGTDGLMPLPDQREHLAPQIREPCAAPAAKRGRAIERGLDTALVVVALGGESRFGGAVRLGHGSPHALRSRY